MERMLALFSALSWACEARKELNISKFLELNSKILLHFSDLDGSLNA